MKQATSAQVKEANLGILQAASGIFDLDAFNTWDGAKRHFTGDHVAAFYEGVSCYWNEDKTFLGLIPQNEGVLRSVYLADHPKKSKIRNDLGRMSLYFDQVLMVDPLVQPNKVFDDPRPYRFDTFQRMRLLHLIRPWVEAGIVLFCPDPFKTDSRLAREWSSEHVDQQAVETAKRSIDQEKLYEAMNEYIEKLVGPKPYYDEEPGDPGDLTVFPLKGDVILQEFLFVAMATKGAPTACFSRALVDELSEIRFQPEPASVEAFTTGLASLRLAFLDKADLDFALRLRKEGRLSSFRKALQEIWKDWGSAESLPLAQMQQEFADRVETAHREARAEWEQIDRELFQWPLEKLGVLIAGDFVLGLGGAPTLITGISTFLRARSQRRAFRLKKPFSVLIDLENKGRWIER